MAHFQDSQESRAVLEWVCWEERLLSVSPCGWVTKKTRLLVKGFESVTHSVVSDSPTPWTVAHQAPLSMGFSRQEYWSGCHSLLQGISLTQGSNPDVLRCRQIPYCLSPRAS